MAMEDEPAALLSLWEQGSLADVQLRCNDGEVVAAHRVVLAACSPFFRALFVGTGRSMREGARGGAEVALPLPSPAVRLLLRAVYSNAAAAHVSAGTVQELLDTASYLSVAPVVHACCEFLRRQLDVGTAAGTLAVAGHFICQELRDEAMRFLQGHLRQVLDSPDIATLQALSLPLLQEVLSADDLEVAAEADVVRAAAAWALRDPAELAPYLNALLSAARAPLAEKDCRRAVRAAAALLDPRPPESAMQAVTSAAVDAAEAQRCRWAERAAAGSSSVPAPRQGTHTGLLVAGGLDEGWRSLKTTELYDPRTDSWQPGPGMPAQCSFPAACTLGGAAFVVEGAAHSPAVLAYDRYARRWGHAHKMPTPRVNMAVAAVSGGVYVMGGRAGTGKGVVPLNTVERYDPGADSWRKVAAMAATRSSLGAAALGGKIYAVGGQSERFTHATVEVYDPEVDLWSEIGVPMRQARKYLAVAAAGGELVVVGGMSEKRQRLASVEGFDPREGRWRALPALSVPCSSCGAAVLRDVVYAAGGSVGGGDTWQAHDGVECWTPAAGRWRRCAPLAAARSGLAVAPV